MTSFLNKPTPWGERRHTTDHTSRSSANTPSASRSSSVASTASNRSEPSWFGAYNGQDTSRKNSSASTTKQECPEKPKKKGISSWLTDDPQLRKQAKEHKKAAEKRKNEEWKREVNKMIITSKHTSAVKAKLATNSELNRRGSTRSDQTTGMVGTQGSAHLTASQQEMRFPHSGPPALHGVHKGKAGKHVKHDEADMPALTRITSGDENDWEDEHMQKRRDEWLSKTKPDVRMQQLSEGYSPNEEDELVEVFGNTVLEVEGTPHIGVDLEGERYAPRPHKQQHAKAGFQKGQNGHWTKPRDGPSILPNT